MKNLLLTCTALLVLVISFVMVPKKHTVEATRYTPTPTTNPCYEYQIQEEDWSENPCITASPIASPSATPTEEPKVQVTPAPAAPPEWSNPCFYLRDHEECKSKEEVFTGEETTFGPQK